MSPSCFDIAVLTSSQFYVTHRSLNLLSPIRNNQLRRIPDSIILFPWCCHWLGRVFCLYAILTEQIKIKCVVNEENSFF